MNQATTSSPARDGDEPAGVPETLPSDASPVRAAPSGLRSGPTGSGGRSGPGTPLLARLRGRPISTADGEARTVARAIIRRHGRGALLPFQLTDDKSIFRPSDLDAGVVFGSSGRFAVVLGDPVGSADDDWEAFDRFVAECRRRGRTPAVYQASGAARARLAAMGFRTFEIGREYILDLPTFGLAGSRRANLRHTVTRARKGGVTFSVFPAGLGPDQRELVDGLEAIDAVWRVDAGPQMEFTIGTFDRAELASLAVAVASDPDGRPIAFATFRPTGADGGWVLDLMRRLPGSTPGAFETCIVEAALVFRDAGARTLSLGLVPLAGLAVSSRVPEERLLARGALAVRRFYDVRGLTFFKTKFDATEEPRYVAIQARHHLPGLAVALVRLHVGGFRRAARGMVVGRTTSGGAR